MSESKHTAHAPWGMSHATETGKYKIIARQGPLLVCPAIAHSEPDAALIVRAVNCHDAAVRMERAIEQFLNGDITVTDLSAAAAAFRAEAAS